jgi:hypothetical protein
MSLSLSELRSEVASRLASAPPGTPRIWIISEVRLEGLEKEAISMVRILKSEAEKIFEAAKARKEQKFWKAQAKLRRKHEFFWRTKSTGKSEADKDFEVKRARRENNFKTAEAKFKAEHDSLWQSKFNAGKEEYKQKRLNIPNLYAREATRQTANSSSEF